MISGTLPKGTCYRWENHAVYISHDGGVTWQLFMYFPKH